MTYFAHLALTTVSMRAITAHNFTPDKRDDWNASRVCLSHASPIQNTPSITVIKQDHEALLKIKYCPRVAAALSTQKNRKKNPCDADLWPMTLKFNRLVEVVEVHVHAKNLIKLRFMSYQQCTRFRTTLDFDREYLWNRSSNRQAENGVMNYDFFARSMKTIWWTLVRLRKNDHHLWPMTQKFSGFRADVKRHVRGKFHRAKCSGHELSCVERERKLRQKQYSPSLPRGH